jgi:hypothetical protein
VAFTADSLAQTHEQAHNVALVPPTAHRAPVTVVKSHLPVTNQLAQSYTFTLNSFRITDTRSVHNDTDFVSVAVAIGNNKPITVPAKSMGDVNNGTYQVNLSIPHVSVAAGDKVAFSYAILNTGHDKDSVEKALTPAAGNAASKAVAAGVTELGSIVGIDPATANAIGQKAGAWLGPKLAGIIFANCDGSVAAGDHVFTGGALVKLTSNGHVLQATDDNKGTDSPVGCGGNSRYYVTWSIAGPMANSSGSSSRGPSGGQHGVETGRHHLQN